VIRRLARRTQASQFYDLANRGQLPPDRSGGFARRDDGRRTSRHVVSKQSMGTVLRPSSSGRLGRGSTEGIRFVEGSATTAEAFQNLSRRWATPTTKLERSGNPRVNIANSANAFLRCSAQIVGVGLRRTRTAVATSCHREAFGPTSRGSRMNAVVTRCYPRTRYPYDH